MSRPRRNGKRVEALRNGSGSGHPSEAASGPHDAAPRAKGLTASALMTAQQLAERWGVPKQQVYRLSRSGEIPVVRIGRYFRYRVDQIEQWEAGGGSAT